MPVTVDVADRGGGGLISAVFDYFEAVDRRFSTYKSDSEIEAINRGEIDAAAYSREMREVLELAERTGSETDGYFDIHLPGGRLDPSGIVKGWAIRNAAAIVTAAGIRDFFIEAGGDIQSAGNNSAGDPWRVGIRSPFNPDDIIKIVYPRGRGVATSGTYVRGQHIVDPHRPGQPIQDIVSLTVIGADVLEADRFATAAFAMGSAGIDFVERTAGLEGYVVRSNGRATLTSGFEACCRP
jgi:thiamine biosynthesis lipoprotein